MTRALIAPPGLPRSLCMCRRAERDWPIFKVIKPLGKKASFILVTSATKNASFCTRAGPRTHFPTGKLKRQWMGDRTQRRAGSACELLLPYTGGNPLQHQTFKPWTLLELCPFAPGDEPTTQFIKPHIFQPLTMRTSDLRDFLCHRRL